jgi:hypothetical protein
MGLLTIEGIVEHGQIKLKNKIHLPENTKVYVIFPDLNIEKIAHIYSPRLAHPEEAAQFKMEVFEEPKDSIAPKVSPRS